jgi:hypothetical protein
VTPPPTDTLAAGSVSTGNDWRLIVAGMAALLAALAYLVPARASVGQDAAIRRLRR